MRLIKDKNIKKALTALEYNYRLSYNILKKCYERDIITPQFFASQHEKLMGNVIDIACLIGGTKGVVAMLKLIDSENERTRQEDKG